MMRALVSSLVALAATLCADLALACPVCAQREGGGALGTVALGALIVAPWIAGGAAAFWIRRGILAEADSIAGDSPAGDCPAGEWLAGESRNSAPEVSQLGTETNE